MTSPTRTVRVRFDGDTSGLGRAAATGAAELKAFQKQADDAGKGLTKTFTSTSGAVLKLGSAVSAVQLLGGALSALAPAAGVAAVLPAVALAGAAAMVTWKLATQGFGDALSAAMSGDPAAYAEAVAGMAPAARAVTDEVRSLRPELKGLQTEAQGQFFNDWAEQVRPLANTYLPVLRGGLGDIALQMGQMGPIAAKALMEPAAVRDVTAALSGTADMFDGLKTAPADVLDGILALAGQGSGELGGLGNAVGTAAQRFRDWARDAAEAGKVTEWIATGKATLREFGDVAGNVGGIVAAVWRGLGLEGGNLLTNIEDLTAGVEDFLSSAEGQDALRSLGDVLNTTADVARDVFLTALREVGPVIVELAPAAEEVAKAVGEVLVGALETAGPILSDVAGFLSDNKDEVAALVPLVAALVVAYKGFKIVSEVKGWFDTAAAGLASFGGKTDAAGKKLGGKGSGLIGKLGAAALAFGALEAASNIEVKIPDLDTAGFESQVQSAGRQLGDMFDSLLAGEFGRLGRQLGDFFGPSGVVIPLSVDDKSAWSTAEAFINGINGSGATVRVDGDTVPLGDAVTTVMDAIAKGHATVQIDGETMPTDKALQLLQQRINDTQGTININGTAVPAGDALAAVLSQINAASGTLEIDGDQTPVSESLATVQQAIDDGKGTVTINGDPYSAQFALQLLLSSIDQAAPMIDIGGNPTPAGQALQQIEALIDAGGGLVQIDGETMPAETALDLVKGRIDNTTGKLILDGNPDPLYQKMAAGVDAANALTGRITLDANPDPALGRISGTVELANGERGVMALDANGAPAELKLGQTKYHVDTTTGVLTIDGNPGPAETDRSGMKVAIDRTTGVLTIDGNPANARTQTDGAKRYADTTTGTMKVNADDSGARSVIQQLRDWASRAVSFVVGAITGNASGALLAPAAVGFADGGLALGPDGRRLTPMSGRTATVVPPNTWRVVGDNMTHPELFAPLDGSAQSLRYIEAAALYYGRRLVPLNVWPLAEGGMTGWGTGARSYLSAAEAISRGPQLPVAAPAAPGATYVTVQIDGEQLRALVRTEQATADRAVRRAVYAGAGSSYR